MLTADPRVVADPVLVPQLSFSEASELAYFGAKVLHPSTILPAVAKNIPVRILNSRRPEVRGTMITAEGRERRGRASPRSPASAGVTVVDITSTRMLMAHGFLRRLFEVFERFRTLGGRRHHLGSERVGDRGQHAAAGRHRRQSRALCRGRAASRTWRLSASSAKTCDRIRRSSRAPSTALKGVPLRLVSQAASRRNITFVLRDADVPQAMNRLHDAFFGAKVAS